MDELKKFLKDPKKKSLTQLGIYVVFFIFVFIIISMGESNDSKNIVIESKKEKDVINNYSYKIDILELGVNNTIVGSYENNLYTFDYNGVIYEYKENSDNLENIFEIERYSYFEIEKLIEKSESETTYKDSNKKIYNINLENDINISLTIEKDKYINHAILDYNNGNIIEIYFTDINKN